MGSKVTLLLVEAQASCRFQPWHSDLTSRMTRSPSPPFAPCPASCSLGGSQKNIAYNNYNHDPVQVFRPPTSVTRLFRRSRKEDPGPGKLEHSGAIILGDEPQKDLEDGHPDSTRVSPNPQDFSAPTSSDSQNQETELSTLGWNLQGQESEREDTSISAAPSNLAPSAPFDSTDKSAQNVTPGNISADKAEILPTILPR